MSVIVPCRNEEQFISGCLNSILQNDYPSEQLEIIVVDGMSTDSTWSVLDSYAARCPLIALYRNEGRTAAAAMNLGVRVCSGDVVFRIDAHARVAADYLRRCVEILQQSGASNVGGAMRTLPSKSTLMARSIAACMSHCFGVGNSDFRTGPERAIFTDTVFGGCYPREVFNRVGLFNERLTRSQDIEFNQRLRRCGGRILLEPSIKCEYFALGGLMSFAKHNFSDGIWSVLPIAHSRVMPVCLRHLMPLLAVVTAMTLFGCGVFLATAWIVLASLIGAYFLMSFWFSVQLAWKRRDILYLLAMPVVFVTRHFGYGLGSLCGVAKLAAQRSLRRALWHRFLGIEVNPAGIGLK